MKKITIYLGAIIMGLASCSNSATSDQSTPSADTTTTTTQPVSDSERANLRNLFLSCMDSVVKATNDPEATQIAEFVRKNNVLAVPHPNGVRYVEGAGSNKKWFAMVPFYKQDASLSNYWKRMVNTRSSGANFIPENRALLINATYDMSNTWKGITTIHEGFHAMTFITHPYATQTDDEYAEEELKAHTLQNRIMTKIGGKKYAALLDTEKKRLQKKITDAGLTVGSDFPERDKNYPELDEFFGISHSSMETDYRGTSFWMQATLELVDDELGAKAHDVKVGFLKALYKGSGIR